MQKDPQAFAALLSKAIYRIAIESDACRDIGRIQDEVGYAIGRDTGGSAIEYWRKGNVPANAAEVEQLALELCHRAGLHAARELQLFLRYAALPDAAQVSARVWGACHREGDETATAVNDHADIARITVALRGSKRTTDLQPILTTIATAVGIPVEQIEVVTVLSGSVYLVLALPRAAADRLLIAHDTQSSVLAALPLHSLAPEPDALAALVIERWRVLHFLEVARLPRSGAIARLTALVREPLRRFNDPLLPPLTGQDLGDRVTRTTVVAALAVLLEHDTALRDALYTVLTETSIEDAQWSRIQHLAVLMRVLSAAAQPPAHGVAGGLDEAGGLDDELARHIIAQPDLWQYTLPRRWLRVPGGAWLTHPADRLWHVRLAHVAALTLVRQPPAPLTPATLHADLRRAHVPATDWAYWQQALTTTRTDHADRIERIITARTPPLPAQAPQDTRLELLPGRRRGFRLRLAVPPAPTVPVLQAPDSLFDATVPELDELFTVTVALQRNLEQPTVTLIVAINQLQREQWQVVVVHAGAPYRTTTTDPDGIARFRDVPSGVVDGGQLTLECLALPFEEQAEEEE